MSLLLVDNYDSFTYNLYQFLAELGAEIVVYRNDEISIDECRTIAPSQIVISPGPGRPENAGVSVELIHEFAGQIPILGVCLGHQCIYAAFGGNIEGAGEIKHGKTSKIHHDERELYDQIPQDFVAVRYQSLVGTSTSLPDELLITSQTENGTIMGVRHKTYTVEGVQFHPESIATEHGKTLLKNFLAVRTGNWLSTH